MKKAASIILVLWSALVCAAFAPLYVPAINVVSGSSGPTQKQVIITSGTSYVVPLDYVSFVSVECIGSGASAGGAVGGGGGAYAKETSASFTAGGSVTIQIGTPSVPRTWFGGSSYATSVCGAEGASFGSGNGGLASTSRGSVKYDGGSAGSAGAGGGGRAGGGGAGGPNGAGAEGGSGVSGTGGASGGGGGGGGGTAGNNTSGGNNHLGSGGGAFNTSGTNGGGGGPSNDIAINGGDGGNGTEWVSAGSGGGGGGGRQSGSSKGGKGGLYGGGGASGNGGTGVGANGVIVFTYMGT